MEYVLLPYLPEILADEICKCLIILNKIIIYNANNYSNTILYHVNSTQFIHIFMNTIIHRLLCIIY